MSEVMPIWDQAAHLYDEIYAGNVPYHRSHAVIVELLPKNTPVRILDLGSGTGLLAERILEGIGGSSVTCVDFSPRMIAECRRRLAGHGSRVDFACADIREWTPPTDYHAIVACNTLVYKEIDVGACYAKYAEALPPGGLFLNSTVVELEKGSALREMASNVRAADGGHPLSQEALEFAQGPGRKIAHFGEGSLAVALPVAEHLALMGRAGLSAACAWRYFSQAVMVGCKSAG